MKIDTVNYDKFPKRIPLHMKMSMGFWSIWPKIWIVDTMISGQSCEIFDHLPWIFPIGASFLEGQTEVSKNGGTPKSSILIGCSSILLDNPHFRKPPWLKCPQQPSKQRHDSQPRLIDASANPESYFWPPSAHIIWSHTGYQEMIKSPIEVKEKHWYEVIWTSEKLTS